MANEKVYYNRPTMSYRMVVTKTSVFEKDGVKKAVFKGYQGLKDENGENAGFVDVSTFVRATDNNSETLGSIFTATENGEKVYCEFVTNQEMVQALDEYNGEERAKHTNSAFFVKVIED